MYCDMVFLLLCRSYVLDATMKPVKVTLLNHRGLREKICSSAASMKGCC
uniref:Uncharacterized protein n=1 Tax=Anguilla anguilla TaxID=7936 RepID=A0A0E9WK97_ANGAN